MIDVSVIIVTCNRKEEFKRAVQSVLEQRDVALELINIDNNSSDGTREIMEGITREASFPVLNLCLEENTGATKARSIGFSMAGGEVVYFLDDDAYLLEAFFLEKLFNFMQKNPEVGCVQTGIFDTGLNGYMKPKYKPEEGKEYYQALSYIGASHAFRRKITGDFEDDILFPDWIFSRSEEFFSALMTYELGYLVAYWPVVRVIHKPSPSMRPPKEDMELKTIIHKHTIRRTLYPHAFLTLSFVALILRLLKHYGLKPGFIFNTWKKTRELGPLKPVQRLKTKTYLGLIKNFGFKSVV